jgi:hypothetical protein
MNTQRLKEFIRRFRAALPAGTSSQTPLILLEFNSEEDEDDFRSRIEIYEIPREDIVKYRHVGRDSGSIREWPIRSDEYEIVNMLPPVRSLVASRNFNLGIVQVRRCYDES